MCNVVSQKVEIYKNEHSMSKTFILSVFILAFPLNLLAQIPTIQDCLGAIPICERIYTENFVQTGNGEQNGEIVAINKTGDITLLSDIN